MVKHAAALFGALLLGSASSALGQWSVESGRGRGRGGGGRGGSGGGGGDGGGGGTTGNTPNCNAPAGPIECTEVAACVKVDDTDPDNFIVSFDANCVKPGSAISFITTGPPGTDGTCESATQCDNKIGDWTGKFEALVPKSGANACSSTVAPICIYLHDGAMRRGGGDYLSPAPPTGCFNAANQRCEMCGPILFDPQSAVNTLTCSDGFTCSTEKCRDGTCVITRDNSACDDEVGCTDDECVAPQGDIPDGVNPTTGCRSVPNNDKCNDNIGCTDDTCDAATGCVFAPDNTKCNDNIGCTDDTCDASTGCVFAPDNTKCDDTIPCTDDTCDAATGCEYEPDDDQCNDGVDCTVDTCTDDGCDYDPHPGLCPMPACGTRTCDEVSGCGVNTAGATCAAQTCKVGTCNADGTCSYANVADGTGCTGGVCCGGVCKTGAAVCTCTAADQQVCPRTSGGNGVCCSEGGTVKCVAGSTCPCPSSCTATSQCCQGSFCKNGACVDLCSISPGGTACGQCLPSNTPGADPLPKDGLCFDKDPFSGSGFDPQSNCGNNCIKHCEFKCGSTPPSGGPYKSSDCSNESGGTCDGVFLANPNDPAGNEVKEFGGPCCKCKRC